MGREIRRVPANWDHPRYTDYNRLSHQKAGSFIPLHDNYDAALKDFEEAIKKDGLSQALEDRCGGPLKDNYTNYDGKELAWYQVYETVSEGTPLTPPFSSKKELIEWMINNEDYWHHRWTKSQAEAFVEAEWAPSGLIENGRLYEAHECAEHNLKCKQNHA